MFMEVCISPQFIQKVQPEDLSRIGIFINFIKNREQRNISYAYM